MKIKPFALERYFSQYEFSAPYMLSSSDCEPLTLQEILAVADEKTRKMWDSLWLGYTESQGHPLLRQEIAKFHSKVKPEGVLVVVPEEGVFIAMNTILEKGDHVIVTFPGYQSLYEIAESLGCEVTKWMPDEEQGWSFNLDFLMKSVKTNTKLIVINFPHNPTGALPTKEIFEQILSFAGEKNIYVFSDEMYRFLEYDIDDRLSSAGDLYENAVSLFGVSKTFSLAGLRIGWLTTQNECLFKKMASFKDYTTICSSAPSEILALVALRAKDKIVARNLEIISRNLELLGRFFEDYKNMFSWTPPKAGTTAFPKLILDKGIESFCLDLVNKKGVMLLPSTVYGYKGNNFRIGFGRKNMPEALAKFREYLNEIV